MACKQSGPANICMGPQTTHCSGFVYQTRACGILVLSRQARWHGRVQHMKLLQASSAVLVGMALCSALFAYQRTADFGFGDDAQTDDQGGILLVAAQLHVQRGQQLSRRLRRLLRLRLWRHMVARLSQGRPPGSACIKAPYADPGPIRPSKSSTSTPTTYSIIPGSMPYKCRPGRLPTKKPSVCVNTC